MVSFSSPDINNNTITENLDIKNKFKQINAGLKRQLIRELSQSQRAALVKIIQKNGEVEVNQEIRQALKIQLENVKNLTLPITRKESKHPLLEKFKRILVRIINSTAFFFNYITVSKANQIIQNALKKEKPVTKTPLPEISIYRLKKLLDDYKIVEDLNKKIDLAKLLREKGFSTQISDKKFSSSFSLKNLNIEGITFNNCKFDWTPCSNTNLKNVIFKNCKIANMSFLNSNIENCKFSNCEMREVMFTGAKLDSVYFIKSSVISSSFEDATLSSCRFESVSMPATHFLEASIADSIISKSNLRDTVFFGNFEKFSSIDEETKETATVTKPLTAILIDPEFRGYSVPKAYSKLDQSAQTIPLRITMKSPLVQKEEMSDEIEKLLQEIGPYDREMPPIPQRLIKQIVENPNENPISARFLRKAEKLATEVHAFLLPGGEDIPPSLYGQEKKEKTVWDGDYRRSLLEISLIHQAFNKGIPLMAICRGFQMSNIYFGAQLIQHIPGHNGLEKLEISTPEKKGIYADVMSNPIFSYSSHHQGIKREGMATEHLEPSVVYEGVIKASEAKESGASPMILIQFHPEFLGFNNAHLNIAMSKENEMFWDLLSESAKAYQTKQVALQRIKNFNITKEKKLNRMVAIEKLENERKDIFEIYQKNHENWNKGLLEIIIRSPMLLERYLKLPSENSFDPYLEERKVLIQALKYNHKFVNDLFDSDIKLKSALMVIENEDPFLYTELKTTSFLPYLNNEINFYN